MSIPTKRLRLSIVLLLLLTMAFARHLPPSRTAPTHLHHPPPTAPTATSYRHHPSPPPSPLSIRPPSPLPSPLSSQLSIPPPPSPPIFIRIPVPSSYANYFESITAFAAFLVAVALLVVFLLMRQSCCPGLPIGPKSIITTICTVFCAAIAGPAAAAGAQVILDAAATGPFLDAAATGPSPAATSPTGPSHGATAPPETLVVHPTTGSPLSAQVATPPPVLHFSTEAPPANAASSNSGCCPKSAVPLSDSRLPARVFRHSGFQLGVSP